MPIEPINKAILRRNMPAGFEDTLKQVEGNVEQVVSDVFDEFKVAAGQEVTKLENELKDVQNSVTDIDKLIKDTLGADFGEQVGKINTLANQLTSSQMTGVTAAQELMTISTTLNTQAKALDDKVNEVRAKVSKITGVVGGIINTGLKATIGL